MTAALPIGPHSYTLFQNSLVDPLLILTHSAWSYTTSPISHTFCGSDITYTAIYEGVVSDENSLPSMAFSSQDRNFKMYAEDPSLIGMTKASISAYLTDYPTIVASLPETVDIEIKDPCLGSHSVTATSQIEPVDYRYTGSTPSVNFALTAFDV